MTEKLVHQSISRAGFVTILILGSGFYNPQNQPAAAQTNGVWLPVRLGDSVAHLKRLEISERREQLRDWAALAAVYQTRAKQPEQLLFDFPSLRLDYLGPVQNYRTGAGRMITLADNRMLAIVPEEAGAHMRTLADLADEYRMLHGQKPNDAAVFAYRLGAEALDLEIRDSGRISGSELFSSDMGYEERTIRTVADLGAALEAVQSITYARRDGAALVVGGRRRQSEGRLLSVDDLAAVYQSGRNLATNYRERLLSRGFREEYLQFLDENAHDVLKRAGETALPDGGDYALVMKQLREKLPYQEFERQAMEMAMKEFQPSTGFSLDPRTNFPELANDLRKAAANDDTLLKSWYLQRLEPSVRAAIKLQMARDEQMLTALEQLLRKVAPDAGSGLAESNRTSVHDLGERDVFTLAGVLKAEQVADQGPLSPSAAGAPTKSRTTIAVEDQLLEELDILRGALEKNAPILMQTAAAANKGDIDPVLEFQRYALGKLSNINLRSGSQGPMVRDVQEMLGEVFEDFNGADGVYGTVTEQVVKAFQKSQGLPSTGNVDSATWMALASNAPEKRRELNVLAGFMRDLSQEKDSYQCARYDGDFRGTAVGMTLFYTDLLMKVWGFDYRNAAPQLDGFVPKTKISVSPMYWQQIRTNNMTRGWLGPRQEAMEFHDKGTEVMFAPIFTRIYNASSDSLFPGREVPANYLSEHFSSWWNSHYTEVADFEPQYYRLNEIMKWSAIFAWLRPAPPAAVASLPNVQVDHSLRFNRWLEEAPDLKFKAGIPFVNSEALGERTECIAIIASEPFHSLGDINLLSGGVTLPGDELVTAKIAVSPELAPIPAALRRADLDFAKSSAQKLVSGQGRVIEFLPSGNTVRTTAGAGARFEGSTIEGANIGLSRSITAQPAGLTVQEEIGEHSLAQVTVSAGTKGLDLHLREGELQKTVELLEGSADSGGGPGGVAEATDRALVLPDGKSMLVRVGDGDRWALFTSGDRQGSSPGSLRLRLGRETEEDAVIVNAEFLPRGQAARLSNAYAWQSFAADDEARRLLPRLSVAPPPNAEPVILRVGDSSFSGMLAGDGFYFKPAGATLGEKLNETAPLRAGLRTDELQSLATGASAGRKSLAALRLADGRVATMSRGVAADDMAAQKLQGTLSAPSKISHAIVISNGISGARVTPEGIIELPWTESATETGLARRIAALLSDDSGFTAKMAQLSDISEGDLSALENASAPLRRSYVDMKLLRSVPDDFAVVDLRYTGDPPRILVRDSGGPPRLMTLHSVNTADLNRGWDLIRDLKTGKVDRSMEQLREEIKPLGDALDEIASNLPNRKLVTIDEDERDIRLIAALRGDSHVIYPDQPNLSASLSNAREIVSASVRDAVVASTVPLPRSGPAELRGIITTVRRVESYMYAIDAPLTWQSFRQLMTDPVVKQITLIARESRGGIVFSDRWMSLAGIHLFLLGLAQQKEFLHLVTNGGPAVVDAFSSSGRFRRIVLTQYASGNLDSFNDALENVAIFFEMFTAPVAVFSVADFDSLLGQNPATAEAFRGASEASGTEVRLHLDRVPAEVRQNTPSGARRTILDRVPFRDDNPNRSIDALIDRIGRDRIQKARTAPAGVRKAGEKLQSIPRLKVELQGDPRGQVRA